MKNTSVLLVVLISVQLPALSQSRVQLLVSGGPTFTPTIAYDNCTGHISTAMTSSLAIIYRPGHAFGVELKLSGLYHPTSYLNNDTSNIVKTYTTSHIVFQRLMAGFNYYFPLKG